MAGKIGALAPSLITAVTFVFAGSLVFLLRVHRKIVGFSARDLYRTFIPFDPLRSGSFHADVKVFVFRKLTDFLFLAPGAAVWALVAATTAGWFSASGSSEVSGEPSVAAVLVVAVVMTLASEFASFAWHYAEHKVPFLWELHKVHHAAETLNPLTNKRAHSLVLVGRYSFRGLIAGVPAGFFMHYWGFGFVEILAIDLIANRLLTTATLDTLRHTEYPISFGPFERLIISPHMHQVHHSSLEVHWDRNFGANLSIFDWAFGTAYRPKKGEKIVYGIYGLDSVELAKFFTLKGMYVDPVVKSLRSVKEAVTPRHGEQDLLGER